MTANAREALRILVAALEEHLEAVSSRRGDVDAAVDDAFENIAIAFERYEDALDMEFAEGLPLVIDEDDELDEGFVVTASDEIPLDPHAAEDEDQLDDDIEEFDLRS